MQENAVLIALGSNLGGVFGSPSAVVESAIGRLAGAGFHIVARSSLWASASWPDPALPHYINAIVIVETSLTPRQVLGRLQAIEQAFGRERAAPNAPRVLDLDLIAYGQSRIEEAGLVVPHPRAHARLFVMGPLAEIAPGWRHPVLGETAAELAAMARVGRDARPLGGATLG
jgi:2-amino-4-hydroxy-6-hydroxymethyldihydropteridine diphosphokinase